MFAVVRDAIDPSCVAEAVRSEACGAVVVFSGIVRERSDDDRPVTGLSYEAHEALAAQEFERIAREAYDRFGMCRVAVTHRIGDLRVGEIAVVVAAASAHRAAAFDICEYVIDELKARAPIWKKEQYAGGESAWKANACAGDAAT